MFPLALVLAVVVVAMAGCDESPTTEDRLLDDVASDQPAAGSAPSSVVPARPMGFRGVFSSVDALQRCKATDNAVVCASTVSAQRVRLARGAASYLGETANGYPAAAPLDFGESIRTASGIECTSSERGIECARGGHGFVLGDQTAIIPRGSQERRHSVEPVVPPDPYGESEPEYVLPEYDSDPIVPEGDGCDTSYEGTCVPDVPYDLDCPDIVGADFASVGADPHGFDGDSDGIACETY